MSLRRQPGMIDEMLINNTKNNAIIKKLTLKFWEKITFWGKKSQKIGQIVSVIKQTLSPKP